MTGGDGDAAGHMDRIYKHQRFIYDLTRKPYLLGRDTLIARLAPPPRGSILEIGCGTGRNLIHTARRYPDAQVFGFDVSAAMLETAAQSIDRAGMKGRITIAKEDATVFDPASLLGRDHFDRIFISYALSMIPVWRDVLAHAVGCLGPRGSLHIVDFGQQERLPRWFRAALFAWLARFSVSPRPDLRAVLEQIGRQRGLSVEFTALYRGYAYLATLSNSVDLSIPGRLSHG